MPLPPVVPVVAPMPPPMWAVVGVMEGEVVRVVCGGEVTVVMVMEGWVDVGGVVFIIPPVPVLAVVPVLISPWPALVGMVAPGVPCVAVVGGEVIIVPPAPEAPDLIGPELIRRDWSTTRRVFTIPVIFGAELEPGAVAVVALPSVTRGRLRASARVPNPDSAAQAAPTATATSRAAEIVRIMCLDQFTVITSFKDTRFAVRGEKPAQVALANRAQAAAGDVL